MKKTKKAKKTAPKMTEREYRAHPAISRSELWRIHESPEKFQFFRDNPPAPTPSLLFGQVVHKLLLEPETFDRDFVVAPAIDRRTSAGKEVYAAFSASVGDRAIITQDDYSKAAMMAQKCLKEPMVRKLLDGQRETPFFWTDPDTGEVCKCRVDCLTTLDSGPVIVDYKTASSAATDVFNHSIYKYGYHFQAAMYSTGVMEALGLTERPGFVFVVQEKAPPYSVNIISVPPEVMLAGLDTYRELLGRYHECQMTGYWYGYTGPFDEPNEAYLPGWISMGEKEEEE